MLTTAQVRAIDRLAVEQYHMPSILLMENASLALLAEAQRLVEQKSLCGVIILVGPGNNGGDGLALARHLANAEIPVRILITREPDQYRGDARINLDIVQAMGISITRVGSPTDADAAVRGLGTPLLIVDALLGTGVDRPVSGLLADLVEWINTVPHRVVLAVDVPTGMDADRGPVLGPCVRADVTVTFVAPKIGFGTPEAARVLGRVITGSIGAPKSLIGRVLSGEVSI